MYKIRYHKLVLAKDIKNISKADQIKIAKVIHKKLKVDPEIFGKPLAAELKGFFRLRIDPYRVIYRIHKEEIVIFILHIGLRKDLSVYLKAAKRLKLISQ